MLLNHNMMKGKGNNKKTKQLLNSSEASWEQSPPLSVSSSSSFPPCQGIINNHNHGSEAVLFTLKVDSQQRISSVDQDVRSGHEA
jgi:hypothetical protein